MHVMEKSWLSRNGVLDIRLERAADGSVTFRRDPTRDVTSQVINVHLVGEGPSDRRLEYRIMMARGDADGWVAKSLFPGRYECTVSHSGLVINSRLDVESGHAVEVVY